MSKDFNKDEIDMELYTNNGVDFLSLAKKGLIDHNYRERSKFPNRVIKNELLPNNSIIRGLYGELIMSYYCGFLNAALSVGMELLEYMTKKKYADINKLKEYPKEDWGPIIINLKNCTTNNRKLRLLDMMDHARQKYRNSQNHGNLFQLVDDCFIMESDLFSGITTKRKYKNDEISDMDGVGKNFKIVEKRQNDAGANAIAISNTFIVEYFILNE